MSTDTVAGDKHMTAVPKAGHDDTEEIISALHAPCKHYCYGLGLPAWERAAARLRANVLEIAHLRRESQRLQYLLAKEGVTV